MKVEKQCWPEEGGRSGNEDQDNLFLFNFICCCEQKKYYSQLIFIATQTQPSEGLDGKKIYK